MESIEMPDVKPKQVLRVFTKLESFKGARDKVIEILQNSVLDPRKIDIQSHEFSWTQQDYDGIGNTSMVVIDARQTRTLITPERRDSNVDHWDELKELQAMSKPPGSILVIIYGDEHSKNLPEDQLLASTWETVWKFNDPFAYSLAEKGVCFSLFDSFSETQRQTIRQYFDEIIFVPEAMKDSNVLVLGNKYVKVIHKVMDKHPMLANEREDHRNTNNSGAYTVKKYVPFNFDSPGNTESRYPTCIYSNVKMPAMKLCSGSNDSIKSEIESQLSSHTLEKFNVGNIPTPSSPWPWRMVYHDTAITFDRLLLFCHCDKCFVKVYEERAMITNRAKTELDMLGVRLVGDILPIVAEDRAELVQRETCTQMKEFLDDEDSNFREDKIARFNMLDSKSKLKIYTWHACMTNKTDVNVPEASNLPPVRPRRPQNIVRGIKRRHFIAAVVIVILVIIIIIISANGNNDNKSDVVTHVFTSQLPEYENGTQVSTSVGEY